MIIKKLYKIIEDDSRNITKWVMPNTIKLYKTEIVVHLSSAFETKEAFRTTLYIRCPLGPFS